MENILVTVPTHYLDTFKKSVEKLNKKSQKFGLGEITAKEVRTFVDKHWAFADHMIGYTELEVTKLSPKLGGWEFIGKLDGTGITNVFYNVPGKIIPEQYRECDSTRCEHCNMARKRTFTYVVRNTQTGEYKQVGRACLKDFMGHPDAERIAQFLMDVRSLYHNTTPHDPERTAPIYQYYNVEHLLALGIHAIEIDGRYISRQAAQECGWSTIDRVRDFICIDKWAENMADILEKNAAKARDVIQFIQAKPYDDQSEFMQNIISAVNSIFCSYHAIGFVLAALPIFHKEVTAKKPKIVKNSRHVGVIGARMSKDLILVRSFDRVVKSNVWCVDGTTGYIHHFEDAEGNVYKWFTHRKLEEGKTYNIVFTVKGHGEFRDVKETVITRARINE
ncbi:hypothetical protein RsoM2USA_104 [Ralstonia phage RsoM2USA]|nr:hypothetical protein RsoM2USA_104 [Ralstonia phage RsoM2USA]